MERLLRAATCTSLTRGSIEFHMRYWRAYFILIKNDLLSQEDACVTNSPIKSEALGKRASPDESILHTHINVITSFVNVWRGHVELRRPGASSRGAQRRELLAVSPSLSVSRRLRPMPLNQG